jgi:heat shock protein HslJ
MNDGSRTTAREPDRYLLTFLNGGKVAIRADCNRVLGTYTREENRIRITPGPSTLAACPPDSLGAEFVAQLTSVSSYFLRAGSLVLEIKLDSGSMTFVATATEIAATSWRVVSYNNGRQAVVTLLGETEISLDFGTDGRVSGNAGCNQYTGGYRSSGDRLAVQALATTFRLCHDPDGLMEQEALYLAALSSAATFEIAGDTLTIRDATGAMQVIAGARESP